MVSVVDLICTDSFLFAEQRNNDDDATKRTVSPEQRRMKPSGTVRQRTVEKKSGGKEKRGGRERNEWSVQQFLKFFVLLDFIQKRAKCNFIFHVIL